MLVLLIASLSADANKCQGGWNNGSNPHSSPHHVTFQFFLLYSIEMLTFFHYYSNSKYNCLRLCAQFQGQCDDDEWSEEIFAIPFAYEEEECEAAARNSVASP